MEKLALICAPHKNDNRITEPQRRQAHRGSKNKKMYSAKGKAPELLEFKDLQTSFYYFRGAGGNRTLVQTRKS